VKVAGSSEPRFWWRAAPLERGLSENGEAVPITRDKFLPQHYPEYERMYQAMHWYGMEKLIDPAGGAGDLLLGTIRLRRPHGIAICEGEKDADTFNALMATIGRRDFFATCLSHPKPRSLAAHHLPLIKGAPVCIVADADRAGQANAHNWACLVWGVAEHVKKFTPPGLSGKPDDKDLSDWVAKRGGARREVAEELLSNLTSTQSLLEAPEIAGDFDFTDDGLMLQLGRAWCDDARYVAEWGRWMFFDRSLWRADKQRVHLTRAAAFLRDLARRTDSEKLANSLRTKGTVVDVLYLATGHPRLAASAEQWDRDPHLLGTPNGGTIDLSTGRTHRATPSDYITKTTAVEPAMAGKAAPIWQAFLERIFKHDLELVSFIQRALGYSLLGSVSEHVLLFCWGQGGNGKGVMLNTATKILGDYSAVAPGDLLLVSQSDRHPTELAMLRGARLVTAQELAQGRAWDEPRLKSLTGGDPITARFMRQDNFTFQPQFTMWVAGNHKPNFKGVDEAIRRRVLLVPFLQVIPASERDRALPEKLEAEWPAILRWMINGCLAFQREGLNPPESALAATRQYLDAEDVLGQWLEERCTLQPGDVWTSLADLYDSWTSWANLRGQVRGTSTGLGKKLDERGLERRKKEMGTGFQGISIKPLALPEGIDGKLGGGGNVVRLTK
jgi:putative DNA primase/helicase